MNRIGLYLRRSVALALATGDVAAHDFWLQPRDFRVEPGSEWTITLQVGHGAARQRSPIPLQRIERFDAIAPDGRTVGAHGSLHPGRDDADASLRLDAPGTWMVVLETDSRAHSRLPALRFNDYLDSEGLTPALEWRRRTRRMDVDGSEIYSRVAKTLVQVGPVASQEHDPTTAPAGLDLEIVPERNPVAEPRAPTLPVHVLYHGTALAGARITLTLLEDDAEPVAMRTTDAAGRAVFEVPSHGSWLLNVVWTRVLPEGSDAEFDTTFSSLSFGYPDSEPP
ncbi:DUF4198 domain-containing protein [Dokdonella sp.]|uniref:DUF4198 domain-containing protein n=1 Tax=Dokdonella sp. TaxID=2291710 RepID=UPI002F4294A6